MSDYVEAWQCIGCGKLESSQPCIGVCQDRKVLLVGADDHDRALKQADALHERIDALRQLLVRFTRATPGPDGWEASWNLLQEQARRALEADAALDAKPAAQGAAGRSGS